MLAFYLAQFEAPEDKEFFEEIYEKYIDRMFHIAASVLQSDFLAAEAVHDAFVKIITDFDKFCRLEPRAQRGWVFTIVSNIAKNIRDKEKRCTPLSEADWLTMEQENADEAAGNFLAEEINKLPDKYRRIFELHYLWGYKVREIAEQTGMTESNVKQYLYRTRQMLKDRLEGYLKGGE